MRGFVAPTDESWWRYLQARPGIAEVNFWRPGGGRFVALAPGEPFFFKLKSPRDAIGGFGLFARFAAMPVWYAWEVFGQTNGVEDERGLIGRLSRLAREPLGRDRIIGCIAVSSVTFFSPDEWVRQPADWSPQIVSGRRYDLTRGEGRRIWEECLERAAARQTATWAGEAWERQRRGKPQVVVPRLGQGSFRLAVLEAYGGACAVTTEHSLPVLDAAHIRPWASGGGHELPNGLPLRRDLHRLFDLGYVTVRPTGEFVVSRRLRDEYRNGAAYYALEGRTILTPSDPLAHPDPEHLRWHNDEVFIPG